jgi:hypothetical protein
MVERYNTSIVYSHDAQHGRSLPPAFELDVLVDADNGRDPFTPGVKTMVDVQLVPPVSVIVVGPVVAGPVVALLAAPAPEVDVDAVSALQFDAVNKA